MWENLFARMSRHAGSFTTTYQILWQWTSHIQGDDPICTSRFDAYIESAARLGFILWKHLFGINEWYKLTINGTQMSTCRNSRTESNGNHMAGKRIKNIVIWFPILINHVIWTDDYSTINWMIEVHISTDRRTMLFIPRNYYQYIQCNWCDL